MWLGFVILILKSRASFSDMFVLIDIGKTGKNAFYHNKFSIYNEEGIHQQFTIFLLTVSFESKRLIGYFHRYFLYIGI
jgi:hypothetical protein